MSSHPAPELSAGCEFGELAAMPKTGTLRKGAAAPQRKAPVKKIDEEADPFDIEVGRRLRAALKAAGVRHARVIEDCGLGQSTFSNYVRGERPLPGKLAHELRERYGITADWLYSADWTGLPARISENLRPAA